MGAPKMYKPTGKRTYVPMNQTGITASAQTDITVLPQLQIRPDRLAIDETTGANFNVVAMKVGVVPQAAAGGSVSALLFSQKATTTDLALDIANSATQLTLTVQNSDTTATHAFTGAFFGDEVEEA